MKIRGLLRRRLDRRLRRSVFLFGWLDRDLDPPRALRPVSARLLLRPKKAIPYPVLVCIIKRRCATEDASLKSISNLARKWPA